MMETLVISTVVLWALVLTNLMLTLALVRRVNSSSQGVDTGASETRNLGLSEGEPAPDFTAETLHGERVSLAEFIGAPTAFVFIKSGCVPCTEQLPDFELLYKAAQSVGERLVLVSVGTAESTQDLAAEFGITCPLLVAPQASNRFMSDYKMFGTPSFTYIDALGVVRRTGRPNRNMREWQVVIRAWESQMSNSSSLESTPVAPATGRVMPGT